MGFVVIKPCAVGYGVYDEPYLFFGEKHEGLYCSYPTVEGCIKFCESNNLNYRIES